ncbi:MAG: rhodanese-like domain-containing protein, partial [Acidobacteriota bacterium]|nr:rhodanese-like domain-containing protein [Acidobacteriota bacterium]
MATPAFSPDEIRGNRDYFAAKLKAEKQRNSVLKAVEGSAPFDFVLLDTRGKEAYANGHIPGALCFTLDDIARAATTLPKGKEIVTYCWGHD